MSGLNNRGKIERWGSVGFSHNSQRYSWPFRRTLLDEEIPAAVKYQEEGHTPGKVVIAV